MNEERRLERHIKMRNTLRTKYIGKEQSLTYHAGYDLGYLDGKISEIQDFIDHRQCHKPLTVEQMDIIYAQFRKTGMGSVDFREAIKTALQQQASQMAARQIERDQCLNCKRPAIGYCEPCGPPTWESFIKVDSANDIRPLAAEWRMKNDLEVISDDGFYADMRIMADRLKIVNTHNEAIHAAIPSDQSARIAELEEQLASAEAEICNQTYHGNSIEYWWQKAVAYGAAAKDQSGRIAELESKVEEQRLQIVMLINCDQLELQIAKLQVDRDALVSRLIVNHDHWHYDDAYITAQGFPSKESCQDCQLITRIKEK